jgi:hypothetical protein
MLVPNSSRARPVATAMTVAPNGPRTNYEVKFVVAVLVLNRLSPA